MSENATTTLSREIDTQVVRFTHRRRRDRRKAFALKLSAAGLGTLITVLLGVRVGDGIEPLLKNLALVAGALVGLLNAWDAFYDHRALWVKRTQTASRLERLQRSFRLSSASMDGALTRESLDRFSAQLDEILEDDLSSWIQLRRERDPAKKEEEGQAKVSPA